MATLLLFGNLGERAVHACRSAFDPPDDPVPPLADYPILAGLGAWVREGIAPPPVPTGPETDRITLQRAFQATIFWEVVERLVRWREAGRSESAESVLLNHLAEATENLDPRVQARNQKAPLHPRIPDRARGCHGERALRTTRHAPRARHDAVLPPARLRGSLRPPERAARGARLARGCNPVRRP